MKWEMSMTKSYVRYVAACAIALLSAGCLAQGRTAEEQRRLEAQIAFENAPIKTREDLIKYLQDTRPANPLMLLSEEARGRLLDTLIVNEDGEISSLWIADIRTELSPSQSYKVLSLFGNQDVAPRVNNGQINSSMDAMIASLKNRPPITGDAKYYCNGGYCTANDSLECETFSCRPPRSSK